MNRAFQLAAAGGLALAAAVAVPAAGQAATRPAGHGHGPGRDGAVFAATDALAGNAVVVYDRSADGTLSPAGTRSRCSRSTATG